MTSFVSDGELTHDDGRHGPQNIVTITVDNNKDVKIRRGRQSVHAIKEAGGVPLAYELEQVCHGQTPPLIPLPDNGFATIKGGESFLSHPRDSGSSWDGLVRETSAGRVRMALGQPA